MPPLRKDAERIHEYVDELLEKRPASSVDAARELKRAGADRKIAARVLSAFDWTTQAKRVAQQDVTDEAATPNMISAGLAGRGFTRQERAEALSEIDFAERGLSAARSAVEEEKLGPGGVRKRLERDGYDPPDIDIIMNRLGVSWDEQLESTVDEMLERGMSRTAIESTLGELGYAETIISRFLRRRRVDWSAQAQRSAERLAVMGLPPDRVESSLYEAGFTATQTQRALRRAGFGTQDLANRMAVDYIKNVAVSTDHLWTQFYYAGVSDEHAQGAYRNARLDSVDWVSASVEPIRKLIEQHDTLSQVNTESLLEELGYSFDQIDNAIEKIEPDWADHAQSCAISAWVEENIRAEHEMREYLDEASFEDDEIDEAMSRFYHGVSEEECAFREACDMGALYMSKAAIERELRAGRYTKETVEHAVDRLFFDWDAHAVQFARRFADRVLERGLAADPSGMREAMMAAGFTWDQANQAVKALDFPWTPIAVELIMQNLDKGGESYIDDLLDYRGFFADTITEAKIISGFDLINWDQRALEMLSNMLAESPLTPDEIRTIMAQRGHTEKSISYAFAHTLIPDNADWTERTMAYIRKVQFEEHYSRKGLVSRLKSDGVDPERIKSVLSNMKFNWSYEAMEAGLMLMDEPYNKRFAELPFELIHRGFTVNQIRKALRSMTVVNGDVDGYWDRRRSAAPNIFSRRRDDTEVDDD